MGIDLIFNHGVDLLAEYTLLESAEGRERLYGYWRDLIALGNKSQVSQRLTQYNL
jgi:hypothetical protein